MSNEPVLLLVGGTGFVGEYLAPALVEAFPDHRRVLLSRGGGARRQGWTAAQADLLDRESIDDLVATLAPSVVIHLAAQASIDAAVHAAEDTWRVNFGGSFALASAIARHAPDSTFFFSSSGEVYGKSFLAGPALETTAPQPLNAYAASKLAAEHMLSDVLPRSVSLIVARAFNHTGAGQSERFALPSFAAQIARIEAGVSPPIMRVGNLTAERDFLHVGDVVDAYIRLLRAAKSESRCCVNVASGAALRIESLLELLRSMARTEFQIEVDPSRMRPSDIPCAVGASDRLRSLTGWAPRQGIEATLEELLCWSRATVQQQPEQA